MSQLTPVTVRTRVGSLRADVLELFQFLDRHRAEVVEELLVEIPEVVPSWMKVPKPELQQTLEHLLEAYGDYLVTDEPDTLTTILRYITKVRAQQSFKLSDVLRALLMVPPALRVRLQEEFREDSAPDARERCEEALQRLEDTSADMACLFVDIFQEYLMNMVSEHQDYLKKTNQKFGVDLSKFILFKG